MTSEPTVFLVDDDEGVREATGLSLRMAGLAVETYASAEEFLANYSPDRPGCLILDVRMPEMSGLELQELLASNHIDVPIIFITGHGDIPMSVQAIKAGAVDFLEKPFRRQVLLDRVKEALMQDTRQRQKETEVTAVQARFSRLTPREQEVMAWIVSGRSNKQIARQLDVSHRTVETHRARVFEKMQARSLPDLVAMAVACGIYDPHQHW